MPYNPAVDTIRERVLDNLEAALRGITGSPTYSTTLRVVRRWSGNETTVNNFPAAILVPGPEQSDDGRHSMVQHTMPVTVLLAVNTQNWPEAINRLLADARVAITADYTRGGVAVTTRILTTEVFEADIKGTLGSAQLNIEVLYRTLYHDPTTAI